MHWNMILRNFGLVAYFSKLCVRNARAVFHDEILFARLSVRLCCSECHQGSCDVGDWIVAD